MAIYRRLKKRRGRTQVSASTVARLNDGRRIKLVFMRDKHKKNWLALLTTDNQCRDFDALIAHATIVFMRYMFIVYECRLASDHRTFGELFYRFCSEVDDSSFIESLYRVLFLAVDQLRRIGRYCEKTASAFFDAINNTALHCVGLSKNDLILKTES